MVLFGWENPLGWLAFLSLVPFFILYLVRPKPVELEVPSLMFFMKSHHVEKEHSFFKRFRVDALFFLQLLILILLSFYFISPFTNLGGSILVDHAVFVLDTSASMQVDNRFQEAKQFVKDNLAQSNTLILINNNPRLAGEDLSAGDAKRVIDQIQVTDGRSNIGDSLMLVNQYIHGEESKVYVVSDFISTGGVSLEAARNALKAKNIIPEIHSVKHQKKHSNVGIVDIRPDEESSTIYFKNYDDIEKKISFSINGESKSLSIKSKFIEPYSFKTPLGVTEIKILDADDFSPDNKGYVNRPERKPISVLLLTDTPSPYLKAALESSGKVTVTITSTTQVPKGNFDVYVVHHVKGSISKDALMNLEHAVQNGKGLIIHAEQHSNTLDYGNLLPLQLGSYQGDSVIETLQLTKLTKDISFGEVSHYFSTKEDPGAILAVAQNSSVLSVYPFGNGKIIYYGILEDSDSFQLQPSYPIFWTNVIRYLSGQGDLADSNVDTGTSKSFNAITKEIKTPSKKIKTSVLFFDSAGIYSFDDQVITASLVDEKESEIDAITVDNAVSSSSLSSNVEEKRYTLEKTVLLLAGILLLLELFFMKFRGEL